MLDIEITATGIVCWPDGGTSDDGLIVASVSSSTRRSHVTLRGVQPAEIVAACGADALLDAIGPAPAAAFFGLVPPSPAMREDAGDLLNALRTIAARPCEDASLGRGCSGTPRCATCIVRAAVANVAPASAPHDHFPEGRWV